MIFVKSGKQLGEMSLTELLFLFLLFEQNGHSN